MRVRIDSENYNILGFEEVKKRTSLIFDNYDLQITAKATEIFKEITVADVKNRFVFAKTTPLIVLDADKTIKISKIVTSKSVNDHVNDVKELADALSELCNSLEEYLAKEEMIEKKVKSEENKLYYNRVEIRNVISYLETSGRSIISLENYFISLYQTHYSEDVYFQISPIFKALLAVAKELIHVMKNDRVPFAETFDIIKEAASDIMKLIENMQKFLAIISLSPQVFSETRGGYMRSANAAIKLISAYHSAVYQMYSATKCITNKYTEEMLVEKSKKENHENYQKNYQYERQNCAVIILPTREPSTEITNLFNSLPAEFHVSIIHVNFKTLFDIPTMLFHLTHEVGHFCGDRCRERRNELFLKAAFRYMLIARVNETGYGDIPDVIFHTNNFLGRYCNESNQNRMEKLVHALDELDEDNKYDKLREKCINEMNKYYDDRSNVLCREVCCNQRVLIENITPREYMFANHYLTQFKKMAEELFTGLPNMELDDATINSKELYKAIREIMNTAMNDIENFSDIGDMTKYKIRASYMEIGSEEKFNKWVDETVGVLYDDLFNVSLERMEEVFEDIYSDIYAVKVLGMEADDYVQYVFINSIDTDYFTNMIFILRVYVVLAAHFKKNDEEIKEYILMKTEHISEKYRDSALNIFEIVIKYKMVVTDIAKEYAELVIDKFVSDYSNMDCDKRHSIDLVRNFYEKKNIYPIWYESMTREKKKGVI